MSGIMSDLEAFQRDLKALVASCNTLEAEAVRLNSRPDDEAERARLLAALAGCRRTLAGLEEKLEGLA